MTVLDALAGGILNNIMFFLLFTTGGRYAGYRSPAPALAT